MSRKRLFDDQFGPSGKYYIPDFSPDVPLVSPDEPSQHKRLRRARSYSSLDAPALFETPRRSRTPPRSWRTPLRYREPSTPSTFSTTAGAPGSYPPELLLDDPVNELGPVECPICTEMFDTDYFVFPCHITHLLCRRCAKTHFERQSACPQCRATVHSMIHHPSGEIINPRKYFEVFFEESMPYGLSIFTQSRHPGNFYIRVPHDDYHRFIIELDSHNFGARVLSQGQTYLVSGLFRSAIIRILGHYEEEEELNLMYPIDMLLFKILRNRARDFISYVLSFENYAFSLSDEYGNRIDAVNDD